MSDLGVSEFKLKRCILGLKKSDEAYINFTKGHGRYPTKLERKALNDIVFEKVGLGKYEESVL